MRTTKFTTTRESRQDWDDDKFSPTCRSSWSDYSTTCTPQITVFIGGMSLDPIKCRVTNDYRVRVQLTALPPCRDSI